MGWMWEPGKAQGLGGGLGPALERRWEPGKARGLGGGLGWGSVRVWEAGKRSGLGSQWELERAEG